MKYGIGVLCLSLIGIVTGCGQEQSAPVETAGSETVQAVDGAQFLLTVEPDGAGDVISVRKDAKDAEEIVIVGRIGGSRNPWIKGRAAFSIVDPSLRACSDIPGDKCKFPWDYCCETDKLPAAMVLVKFVDEQGNVVKADARELLELKELQTVVIRGKAQRDEEGNLTVLASGLFVKE